VLPRSLFAERRARFLVAGVAVCGVAVTSLASTSVATAQGLYAGKVEVVLRLPPSAAGPNPLASENYEAVRFAALVAEITTNGEEVPRVTNQDLTLADQGMRHETLISLVNLGGQWANDFRRPFIRIEAVDESPEAVETRIQGGVARVNQVLERMQDDANVATAARATTEVVPAVPQVRYEATHRERAVLVTALLGLFLTVGVCRTVARRSGLLRPPPAGDDGPLPPSDDGATEAPPLLILAGGIPDDRRDG
jgi:hypothetical protein